MKTALAVILSMGVALTLSGCNFGGGPCANYHSQYFEYDDPRSFDEELQAARARAACVESVGGVAQVETVAFAACGRLVLVLVSDARCAVRGVWLDGPDVMPR